MHHRFCVGTTPLWGGYNEIYATQYEFGESLLGKNKLNLFRSAAAHTHTQSICSNLIRWISIEMGAPCSLLDSCFSPILTVVSASCHKTPMLNINEQCSYSSILSKTYQSSQVSRSSRIFFNQSTSFISIWWHFFSFINAPDACSIPFRRKNNRFERCISD